MPTAREVSNAYWSYHECAADESWEVRVFCEKFNIPEEEMNELLKNHKTTINLYAEFTKLKEAWETETGTKWENQL
jgi:hypothetical protein